MHHIFTRWLGAAALVALGMAVPAQGSTLKIVNNSRFEIFYLHVSSSGSSVAGPDLLGFGRVIAPYGGVFTVTDIACGAWDIWLVDQDGDVCLRPVDLCNEDMTWSLTSERLVGCENATQDFLGLGR